MTKISALSDIGTSVASNDTFVLVDVSDPTTPNKKIQQQNILAAGGLLPDGSAGTPGLRFLSDTNVGLFRPTTDTLAIATGGSERLRIDSSGRLGLGTSSPQSALDITSGTFQSVRTYLSSITDTYHQYRGTPDGTGYEHARVFSGRDTSVHTYGSYLAFYTEGKASGATDTSVERLRIDSSGRVGIGTTSPGQALHVVGKGRFQESASSGAIAFIGANATEAYIDTGTYSINRPLAFKIEGTERARIDSSGRLLVGTSSQSGGSLLQVNDDRIRIASSKTPASASDTGTAGEICWDADYIYVCTATDTWKRTAISTW